MRWGLDVATRWRLPAGRTADAASSRASGAPLPEQRVDRSRVFPMRLRRHCAARQAPAQATERLGGLPDRAKETVVSLGAARTHASWKQSEAMRW
jgi:hypothetical protein